MCVLNFLLCSSRGSTSSPDKMRAVYFWLASLFGELLLVFCCCANGIYHHHYCHPTHHLVYIVALPFALFTWSSRRHKLNTESANQRASRQNQFSVITGGFRRVDEWLVGGWVDTPDTSRGAKQSIITLLLLISSTNWIQRWSLFHHHLHDHLS